MSRNKEGDTENISSSIHHGGTSETRSPRESGNGYDDRNIEGTRK